MITEFFVLGGIAFWVLASICALLFFCLSEDEDNGFNLYLPVLLVLTLVVFGNLGGYVLEHPWRWLAWSAAYLATGFAWSFPRWFILLGRLKREYDEELADFQAKGRSLDDPKDRETWSNFIASQWPFYGTGMYYGNDGKLTPPQFERCRGRMYNWVLLWPWSMVWTLVRDALIQVVDWFVDLFGRWHQAISDWVFKEG